MERRYEILIIETHDAVMRIEKKLEEIEVKLYRIERDTQMIE